MLKKNLSAKSSLNGSVAHFSGFALPTSNTTYTPNQFFDICMRNYSRGVVRLVAYLLRKTLGWSDRHGNPQAERHAVSYSELQAAGISRDMIRLALDEAINAHFIRCVQSPQPKRSGQPAVSGLYELQWDENGEYTKDPRHFRGFFAGEGNRTYIPNQFFDQVIPSESLAVVKVVGSIMRFSIGFQNKWGHRRTNVALSYQHIRNYSHLRDRTTLSQAIRRALTNNYIQRVAEGYFDRDGGKLSRAAVYAIRWLNGAATETNGQKTRPAEIDGLNRSENQTGIGRKSRPAQRSENQTDIEIKQSNKTSKQQADAVAFERLKRVGFGAVAAAGDLQVERLRMQLFLDRHGHAQRDRSLATFDMTAEVEPSLEGMDRSRLNPPLHALKQCENLIADRVVPESAIGVGDDAGRVHGLH